MMIFLDIWHFKKFFSALSPFYLDDRLVWYLVDAKRIQICRANSLIIQKEVKGTVNGVTCYQECIRSIFDIITQMKCLQVGNFAFQMTSFLAFMYFILPQTLVFFVLYWKSFAHILYHWFEAQLECWAALLAIETFCFWTDFGFYFRHKVAAFAFCEASHL